MTKNASGRWVRPSLEIEASTHCSAIIQHSTTIRGSNTKNRSTTNPQLKQQQQQQQVLASWSQLQRAPEEGENRMYNEAVSAHLDYRSSRTQRLPPLVKTNAPSTPKRKRRIEQRGGLSPALCKHPPLILAGRSTATETSSAWNCFLAVPHASDHRLIWVVCWLLRRSKIVSAG